MPVHRYTYCGDRAGRPCPDPSGPAAPCRTVALRLVSLVLALGCLQASRASIVIDSFSASTNDRFANHSAFILDGYDLSGLGMTAGGPWGTLISPNVVVSAAHYAPGVGGTLYFYASNNPAGGSVSRTVVAAQQVGSSDLWVGALNEPLPSGYAPFSYATTLITDSAMFLASGYAGAAVYMVGRSPTADNAYGSNGSTDSAVGANVLDAAGPVSGTTEYAVAAVQNLSGDGNYVSSEAYLQPGDSSGPLFTITGGSLQLLGINWFIDTIDIDPGEGESWRNVSGFSYVGNHASELQAFVDAHPVPEPASLVLLVLPALVLLAFRRH